MNNNYNNQFHHNANPHINGAPGENWQQPAPQQTPPQNYQYAENVDLRTPPREIKVTLDEEAYDIWESTQPELRGAMVNVAMKYFANDPMYMNYFLNKATLENSEIPQQMQPVMQQPQQPQPQQPSPTVSMGLDSWD